jgi:hypothetical protein
MTTFCFGVSSSTLIEIRQTRKLYAHSKEQSQREKKRNYSVDLLYSCSVCVGGTIFRGSKQKQYFSLFCVPEGGGGIQLGK